MKNLARLSYYTFFGVVFLFLFSIPVLAEDIPTDTVTAVEENIGDSNANEAQSDNNAVQSDAVDPNNAVASEENAPEEAVDDENQSSAQNGNQPTHYTTDMKQMEQDLSMLVDEKTGALNYSYSIQIPKGRNGFNPIVGVSYNSQENNLDGNMGKGWSLGVPAIERQTKYGVDKTYTQYEFISSFSGELKSINIDQNTGEGEYGARFETGEFIKYFYSSSTGWRVVDKQGREYLFGYSALSRQDDPTDPSRVFKWMLTEMRDTNGNIINYTYTKQNGQIYPQNISYVEFGSSFSLFNIEFSLENRPVYFKSYRTGFYVQSDKFIDKLTIKENGVWVKEYDFVYTIFDRGPVYNLTSILESGREVNQSVGEAINLTSNFSYTVNSTTFERNLALPPPASIMKPTSRYLVDNGVRFGDMNGDGRMDAVFFGTQWTLGHTFINTAHGWEQDTRYIPPQSPNFNGNVHLGSRMVDVNADGLVDLVRALDGYLSIVHLNIGVGWTTGVNYNLPVYMESLTEDYGVRFADVNGDGFPDIVQAHQDHNRVITRGVYMNRADGTGWDSVTNTAYTNSLSAVSFFSDVRPRGTLNLVDVNADGLTDLVEWGDTWNASQVYINNGTQWVHDPAYTGSLPQAAQFNGLKDYGMILGDANGDGVTDIFYALDGFPRQVFIGSTGGWGSDPDYNLPVDFATWVEDYGGRVIDFNGDGMDDILKNTETYSTTGTAPNFLSKIQHHTGVVTNITYEPITQHTSIQNNVSTLRNQSSRIPLQLVTKIETSGGVGATTTYSYVYDNGYYYLDTNDPFDRRFAGFSAVERTDALGNKTKTYFHQGNTTDASNGEYNDTLGKVGRIYKVQKQDDQGNIYETMMSKWEETVLGNGRFFIKNTHKISMTYDGDATHRDRAESFVYDNANGNLLTHTNHGEVNASQNNTFVDVLGDEYVTSYTYAVPNISSSSSVANTTYMVGLPSSERVEDSQNNKVREARYYYDNLPFGEVSRGNATRVEQWVSGTNYVGTDTVYNSYGLPIQTTDPNGNITTYTYDTYNLYPTTITNALNQATTYQYSYTTGEPTRVTDPNGFIVEKTYDGLGRVKLEKQSNPTTPTALDTTAEYIYTDNVNPRIVQKRSYLNDTNIIDSYTYLDGLDRPVQERREDVGGSYITVDYTYNNRGELNTQSLPYRSTGSSQTLPTTNNNLLTTYTYDPIGRPLTKTNVLGTESYLYDDWTVTTTDLLSTPKGMVYDTYGRLVEVRERNRENNIWQTYTTLYNYDGNNNLIKITDALGHVRTFAYDGLSRRIGMTKLHDVNNLTPDNYSFQYDNVGNMTQETDGRAVVTDYLYDALNRPIRKTLQATGEVLTTYTYDSCIYGIGRLCEAVEVGSASSGYLYDVLGRVVRESKSFSESGLPVYQTSYIYGRAGNVLQLTYPNNDVLDYGYNSAGQVNTISRNSTPLVTATTYNELGLVETKSYGNGTSLANTYDSNELYRLRNKNIIGLNQSNLASFVYAYDLIGNITQITETYATVTPRTKVYTYDDLSRLVTYDDTTYSTGTDQTYTYDAVGNRTNYTNTEDTYTYTNSPANELTNINPTVDAVSIGNTYDQNGNLTQSVHNRLGQDIKTINYSWDVENRLGAMVAINTSLPTFLGTPAPETVWFSYDHEGNRVKKHLNGSNPTYYLKSGLTPLHEISSTGVFEKTLIHSSPGANPGNQIAQVDENGVLTYLYQDHLGSTILISDQSGNIKSEYDYDPYGAILGFSELDGQETDYLYTGQEYDPETELHYYGARYYDDKVGRFVSVDPAVLLVGHANFSKRYGQSSIQYLSNPQNLNGYSYANNNPISNIDPDGESILSVLGKVAGPIGLLFDAYDLFNPVALSANDEDLISLYDRGIVEQGTFPSAVMMSAVASGNINGLAKNGDEFIELHRLQPRIRETFTDDISRPEIVRGRSIDDVAADIKSGLIKPEDLPVHYYAVGDKNVVLNNRTLEAFNRAGVTPIAEGAYNRSMRKFAESLAENSSGVVKTFKAIAKIID